MTEDQTIDRLQNIARCIKALAHARTYYGTEEYHPHLARCIGLCRFYGIDFIDLEVEIHNLIARTF